MRKATITAVFLATLLFVANLIIPAQDGSHFSAAFKFAEMTFNKEAVYHQLLDVDLLLAKERYENNPTIKEYSEVLVGVIKEVLDEYFNDPETQKKLKANFAKIYMEEFTEKELLEMIEFYGTNTGEKLIQKSPLVMEKARRMSDELAKELSSPKYEQITINKLIELQKIGLLPKEF